MGRLKLVAAVAALALAAPARAETVDTWRAEVAEASARFGVPASWITRVMRAESGGKTQLDGRPIRSRAGAIGLMQVMPATWAEMRAALRLGSDPDDPRDNILAGTYYLRLMYDRFGYPGCFAAYNAGPRRYRAWLAGRATLPAETRSYLLSVVGSEVAPSLAPPDKPARPGLFFALGTQAVENLQSPSGLFVALSRRGPTSPGGD